MDTELLIGRWKTYKFTTFDEPTFVELWELFKFEPDGNVREAYWSKTANKWQTGGLAKKWFLKEGIIWFDDGMLEKNKPPHTIQILSADEICITWNQPILKYYCKRLNSKDSA